ncbi:MAG: hypothetical protein Ct9H90mP30_4790 [Actinomycetota bacterium]|nr:MAG: hypothetical protein Ct9H90mP30_4790 [Actinomycetota bacterium]
MILFLQQQNRIRDIAFELAPSRRYWAIVGNGLNMVAAREIRIKLSELCYKSIAADFTEDKKHIDLSAGKPLWALFVPLDSMIQCSPMSQKKLQFIRLIKRHLS